MPNKKLACLIKTTLKILFDFLTLKMKKKKKKKKKKKNKILQKFKN
jgi:predicted membrane protein